MLNGIDVSPGPKVTCPGTVASDVSLLVKATVSGCDVSMPLRVSVPVVAAGPAFSAIWSAAIVSVRFAGVCRSSSDSIRRRRFRRMVAHCCFVENVERESMHFHQCGREQFMVVGQVLRAIEVGIEPTRSHRWPIQLALSLLLANSNSAAKSPVGSRIRHIFRESGTAMVGGAAKALGQGSGVPAVGAQRRPP